MVPFEGTHAPPQPASNAVPPKAVPLDERRLDTKSAYTVCTVSRPVCSRRLAMALNTLVSAPLKQSAPTSGARARPRATAPFGSNNRGGEAQTPLSAPASAVEVARWRDAYLAEAVPASLERQWAAPAAAPPPTPQLDAPPVVRRSTYTSLAAARRARPQPGPPSAVVSWHNAEQLARSRAVSLSRAAERSRQTSSAGKAGPGPTLTAAEEVHLSRLLRMGQAAESVRRGLADGASDTEWAFSCGLPSAAALRAVLSQAHSARSLLLLRNIGLVKSAARRFNASLGKVRSEDLVSDGLAGLSSALEAYDPERGYRLSTFALTRVEAAQRRAIQNGRAALRVPVWLQEVHAKLQKARTALAATGELQPTDVQLAEAASTPLTHVRAAATAFSRREASFDEDLLQASESDDWTNEVSATPDTEPKEFEQTAATDPWVKASVEMFEQTLQSPVQREALRAIYGLDGSAPQAQSAVAKRLGLTRYVVSTLMKKALKQLSTVAAV